MALFGKKKKKAQPDDGSDRDVAVTPVSGDTAIDPAPEDGDLKTKALSLLYPATRDVKERQRRMVNLPAQASGYFDGIVTADGTLTGMTNAIYSVSADESEVLHNLPFERTSRYGFLDIMAEDPTIDLAIKMHIGNALSPKQDTGEVFSIESASEETNHIVEDLRHTFQTMLHQELHEWAYGAAVHGTHFCRVYGKPGEGVSHIRSDYYTHPRFIIKYEQAGRPAGYATAWQGSVVKKGNVRLMDPWTFVEFKIPHWNVQSTVAPNGIDAVPVDLGDDDFTRESLVESQDYGTSIIEKAYQSWRDLLEAITSLNMSRKNAARLERVIGVNTGRLDPRKAAEYLNLISRQIQSTDKEMAKKSLRRGFVQTVLNHIIPIFGDTKGRLDINSVQGSPDIQGLEDVMFHVKRMCAALGSDPSLLGFGDLMSGGLGEGGFFRVDLKSAIVAQFLRKAIQDGIERILEIHVAYKYGKVFLPGEKPWKVTFHSVNSALEREEQENRESRANYASAMASIVATLDPESYTVDKRSLFHLLFVDNMKYDEARFDFVFPPGKKAPENVPSMGAGGAGMGLDPNGNPMGEDGEDGNGGKGGGSGGPFESAGDSDLTSDENFRRGKAFALELAAKKRKEGFGHA